MKDNNDWRAEKLTTNTSKAGRSIFKVHTGVQAGRRIPIWGLTVRMNHWAMIITGEYALHPKRWDFCTRSPGPQLQKMHCRMLSSDDQNHWRRTGTVGTDPFLRCGSHCISVKRPIALVYQHLRLNFTSLQYTIGNLPAKHIINTGSLRGCGKYLSGKMITGIGRSDATDWVGIKAAGSEIPAPEICAGIPHANDIIGCLNNRIMDGWIDWNMVLDKRGGPNWFRNWCTTPVIVDPEKDAVYTPLLYRPWRISQPNS